MGSLTRIGTGRCVGCCKISRLRNGACKECVTRHGIRCGPIMQKIRDNKVFAIMCYNELTGDSDRERFISMFGDPRLKACNE